jgi:sulfate transport system ATP-binding protein
VFENIAFGLRVRPRKLRPREPELRRKVNELLDLIQLGRWSNHFPSQLSGGQRQRVALARALAIEPSVLLLDEPFGALDAKVRQELRRWLRTLHAKIPVTSVLVTHDQEEALEVADRIVIMNQGRVEQTGTPDEVFHNPVSEFVVTFLGNVNLFHARTEASNGEMNAQAARMFVRPHELDIQRFPGGATSVAARINRIQSAGPIVRLELSNDQHEPIFVELTHERLRELDIKTGETVFVIVRESRVFVASGPKS